MSTDLRKDFSHLDAIRDGNFSFRKKLARQSLWSMLQLFSRTYVKVEVVGDWSSLEDHEKLILVSNHSSHLDAATIMSSMPYHLLDRLFFVVARDYFFSGPKVSALAKTFLNGIPIDRDGETQESMQHCMEYMKDISPMWTVVFPEGTRSLDGKIQPFKKGVSLMSRRSETSVVFLYMHGAHNLFPKGKYLPRSGSVKLFIGPVIPPKDTRAIEPLYHEWLESLPVTAQRTPLDC